MTKSAKTIPARFAPRTIVFFLLGLAALAQLAWGLKNTTSHAAAARTTPIAVHAAGRGAEHRLNLRDGVDVPVQYQGGQNFVGSLQSATVQPLNLASVDFDMDGAPDLVTSYRDGGRTFITLQRGNLDAFAPQSLEVFKAIQEGRTPPALLPAATVMEVPEAGDFLLTADFNHDGSKDLLMAARGGGLYLLAGDGRGGLQAAGQISTAGSVTALAAGDLNVPDGLVDVAVGINGAGGPSVVVYDGAQGGLSSRPVSYSLPAEASSLAIARLDKDALPDLAVATGNSVAIIHGSNAADASASRVETVNVPFAVKTLAVGEFVWDRENIAEIALLSSDGAIQVFERGSLDTRPFTTEETLQRAAQLRRFDENRANLERALRDEWQPGSAPRYQFAQQLDTSVSNTGAANPASLLMRASITRGQTDDLMLVNSGAHQLNVLKMADASQGQSAASLAPVVMDVEGAPVAALTMQRKANGEQEILVLREGSASASSIISAPTAIISVDRTDDTAAASACTGATNDCSLRGAVTFANANAGTQINLAATNYNLTISGGISTQGTGEGFTGNNTIGDLDVTMDTSSIVGLGANSTTITQTTPTAGSPSNDRVIELNPPLAANFDFTITGVKLTGGKSPDGGGAMIGGNINNTTGISSCSIIGNQAIGLSSPGGGTWNIGGGNVTIASCTYQSNSSDPSSGGAVNQANAGFAGSVGILQITGSTFGGNTTALGNSANGAANSGGGAISITDLASAHSIGTSTFQNNTTTTGSAGGGALLMASGSMAITQTTFTSNSVTSNLAGSGGGAIAITGGTLAVSNSTTFTSNTTNGGFGGGAILLTTTSAGSHTITATFKSNQATNATSAGGALYLAANANTSITNSTFGGSNVSDGNTTSGSGGGGAIAFVGTVGVPTHTVSSTTFQNNRSTGSGPGGALLSSSTAALTLTDLTFTSNSSNTGNGGAMAITGTGNPTISGTTPFTSNSTTGSGSGGALALTGAGTPSIAGTTTSFSSNSSGGSGGALFASGGGFTLTNVPFTNNSAGSGGGAMAFGGAGTYSVQLSTITGNSVTGAGGGGAILMTGAGTVNANFNRLVNNTAATAINGLTVRRTNGTVNATNNWWGNQGPKTNDVNGTATTTPYIELRLTSTPSTINVTQSTALTASFLSNSAGTALTLAQIARLIGLPVVWSGGTLGSISGAETTIQADGKADSTFTAGCTGGTGQPTAAVDTNGIATTNITINKYTTSTAATSSVNPSKYGQQVTFTATVTTTGTGCAIPSGQVQFKDGGSNLGSPANMTGGVATLDVSDLSVGNHTITADYLGDQTYSTSTGALNTQPQVVQKGDTTTAVVGNLNPSNVGQTITYTATVAAVLPAVGVPGGSVQFKDNGNNLGSPAAMTAGVATLQTNALTVGDHTITADYLGDNNFNTSSGSLVGNPQVVRNTLAVSDISVAEGNIGSAIATVTVRLGAPATAPGVTFNIATADNTATSPTHYVAQSLVGEVIAVGVQTKTFNITIPSDIVHEPNRNFFVNVTGVTNTVLTVGQAIVTIVDDDPTRADFDNDGRADQFFWNPSNGNWYGHQSSTNQFILSAANWGLGSLGDIPVPGDYDGDGKQDIAIWRASEGNWYIIYSASGGSVRNWGLSTDIPVPADYDGDGVTDLAVWRGSEGNWYIIKSNNGSPVGYVQAWGISTDKPLRGDFDGDGKTDIAIYRPSERNWYIINSSTGALTLVSWGLSTDKLAYGDYDGDGKTDIAVFRPSDANWYIRNSSGGVTIKNWGTSADTPVPGNYDGDNKTDIAVWRESDGNWYIINSSTNTASLITAGTTGNIPIPATYIR